MLLECTLQGNLHCPSYIRFPGEEQRHFLPWSSTCDSVVWQQVPGRSLPTRNRHGLYITIYTYLHSKSVQRIFLFMYNICHHMFWQCWTKRLICIYFNLPLGPQSVWVLLWNHARVRSLNQPVLSNEGDVFCIRKQWKPSIVYSY